MSELPLENFRDISLICLYKQCVGPYFRSYFISTSYSRYKLGDEVRGIDPIHCIYIYSCIILEEYIEKFECWLRFKLRKDTDAVLRPASTEAVFLCFWETLFLTALFHFAIFLTLWKKNTVQQSFLQARSLYRQHCKIRMFSQD